jgi:hypothetical protein
MRCLPEFAEHFRLQQSVLQSLGFEDRDSQSRDTVVKGATLTLDSGTTLQRAGDCQVIIAAAGFRE